MNSLKKKSKKDNKPTDDDPDGEKLAASGKSVGKVVNAVKNSPNDVLKFELMRIGAGGAPEVKIVELRPSATPTGTTAGWARQSRG
mgnify:CR=1 FL=1